MNKTTIGLMVIAVLLLLAIPAEFLIYINVLNKTNTIPTIKITNLTPI